MQNGYIQIHRKIFDNPISNKPNYLAVWLYIVSLANFKDNYMILNGKKKLVKKGSFVGSISKIADHFNMQRSTVKKIIDYFETDQMLYTERTRNYTVFTVKNYCKYQEGVHQENTKKTPSDNRLLTNNKDNKDNKDNKEIEEEVLQAFDDYNSLAHDVGLGKVLKITPKRKTAMKARLAEHGIDGWRNALMKVRNSDFCCGKNDRGWRADIDFLLSPAKLLLTLEGKYDNAQNTNTKPTRYERNQQALDETIRQLEAERSGLEPAALPDYTKP